MAKNIVICSDGTGNTANKGRGTNVFKLYEAVDLHNHPQLAFYDDGVGTNDLRIPRILGGAFGWGLARNVRSLYTELARVYEPGDRIFLFGFSRGAFTIRTVAGLILACGVPDRTKVSNDRELQRLATKAYDAYRSKYHAWLTVVLGWVGAFACRLAVDHVGRSQPPIHLQRQALPRVLIADRQELERPTVLRLIAQKVGNRSVIDIW